MIGRDPEADNFIWLAGQGGNGVMAGAAAARLAASLATSSALPADIAALGITEANVSPGRSCMVEAAGQPVVGRIEQFEIGSVVGSA